MKELMDLKERMEHERPAQWHELPDIALYDGSDHLLYAPAADPL